MSAWDGFRGALWKHRTPDTEKPLIAFLKVDAIENVYLHGKTELISPNNWNTDFRFIERPNARAPDGPLLRLPHQRRTQFVDALRRRRRTLMEFPLPDKVRRTKYRFADVEGLQIFWREAGADTSPALLLLHGFPTSSHMFRDLIPALADEYYVVAPDLPGFGFSDAPERTQFKYTFDHLADVMDRFTTVVGLSRHAIYVFDYGAPVGFRLAMRHPQRITAIISQNGNAYEEGLSEGWNPIQRYWKEPTPANRAALRDFLKPETTKFQYLHGVQDESLVAPESYALDAALLARPGNDEIQLDLFLDYASNVALYPKFQEYFRRQRPPLLAVWGKNDPFFLSSGAEAFTRDDPNAEVKFFDTGHFALETHHAAIAAAIRDFLSRLRPRYAAR